MQNDTVILNFQKSSILFDDENEIQNFENIHIITRKRNSKNFLTFITGIDDKYDYKLILSDIKKEFACNGAVIHNKTYGKAIQLNGNHKDKVAKYLINSNVATKDMIKLQGV